MIHMVTPHSLTKIGQPLRANSMGLQLNERGSTASVNLDDRSGLTITNIMSQWFYDDANPGKGIVWRARSITDAYHTKTPSLQLEHVISVLRDQILFGEVTPAMITGHEGDETCTAKQAIEFILSKQDEKDWELGSFANEFKSVKQAYSFDGETLFDALETVSSTLEDCWWTYDFSSYPFKLNITKQNDEIKTMLRASRNIRTISVTTDKSGMYTCFYPIGKDDLHLKGGVLDNGTELKVNYVTRNSGTYGKIEHVETDTSKETVQELYDWAVAMLNKHKNPVVKIDVEGLELSNATGEPLDKIHLGRMCSIILKELGRTFEQRVVEMSYPDKANQPEVVRITLSNKRDDVTKIIARDRKTASKSARVQARQSKQTREILYNTVKELQIAGPDKNQYKLQYKLVKDTDWQDAGTFSRAVTGWDVSATGGTITVTAQPQNQSKGVRVRQGTLTRDGYTYSGQVQWYDTAETDTSKRWKNTGAGISVDAEEMYSVGWGEARKKVSIPKTQSTADSYIYVKVPGDTIDTQESNTYAMSDHDDNSVNLRWWDASQTAYITVARYTHNKYTSGYNTGWGDARGKVDIPMTASTANSYIYVKVPGDTVGAQLSNTYAMANNDDNSVNLRWWDASQSEYVTVARLTHGKYDAGWGAARSKVDLPMTEQTANAYVYVKVPGDTVSAQLQYTYTMVNNGNNDVDLWYWDSEQSSYITVARISHNKYTSGYNTGWGDARGKVDIPMTASTANSYIYVKVPGDTVGAQLSNTYAMSDNNNNSVNLRWWDSSQSAYVTVARLTHGKYDAGWGAARGKVELQLTQQTANSYVYVKVPGDTVGAQLQYTYSLQNYGNNATDLRCWLPETTSYVTIARLTHNKYDAGWTEARTKVEIPKTSSSANSYIYVKVPADTVGAQESNTYAMSNHNNNSVDLQWWDNAHSEYVTVARLTHNKYNAGWGDAYDQVDTPEASTELTMEIKVPKSSPSQTPPYSSLIYAPDSDANYCYIKNGTIVMARKAQYFNRAINWTISITTTSSNVKYTLTHTFNHGEEPGWTDGGNKTLYYHV